MTRSTSAEPGRLAPRVVAVEAWRNLTSGAAGALVQLLVFAVMTAVAIALTRADIERVEHRLLATTSSGGTTWIARSGEGVDAALCDAQRRVPGVGGAVATRLDGAVRVAALSGLPIDVLAATPGFGGVVTITEGDAGDAGVLLGRPTADSLGLRAGDALVLTTGERWPVAGVFSVPWNDDALAHSIVIVASPSSGDPSFDRCLTRAEHVGADAGSLAAVTARTTTGSSDLLSPANPRLGDQPDFPALVAERSTSPLLVASVGAAFAAAFFSRARRALGDSMMVNLGVGHLDLIAVGVVEQAFVAIGRIVAVAPMTMAALPGIRAHSLRMVLVADSATCVAASIAGALAGVLAAAPLAGRRRLLVRFRSR